MRADELLRYMRRASKKAAKILAELAPLEALEAKQRSRLSEPPSRAVAKGGGPDLEKIKKEIAARQGKARTASVQMGHPGARFQKTTTMSDQIAITR